MKIESENWVSVAYVSGFKDRRAGSWGCRNAELQITEIKIKIEKEPQILYA